MGGEGGLVRVRNENLYLLIVRSDIFIPQNIGRRRANYILCKSFVVCCMFVCRYNYYYSDQKKIRRKKKNQDKKPIFSREPLDLSVASVDGTRR